MALPSDFVDLLLNYILICLPSYCMSAYVFCKSQDIVINLSRCIYIAISGTLFTALFVLVRFHDFTLSCFIYYILVPSLLTFLQKDYEHFFNKLVTGLVSVSLVFVLEVVSNIILGTVSWILNLNQYMVFVYIFSQLLAMILCGLFMNIKRLKRGLQFFQKEKNAGLGLSLSVVVMILKCLNLRDNQDADYMYIVFIVGVIIAGFGLYLWIRRSITAHYRERLQSKSEEHYKEMLEERDKELENLSQSNEYLAKIVHRDNHLMDAVNSSVNSYFESDNSEYKDQLLRDLHTLTKERADLINQEQLQSKLLPTTGNHLIDGTINDLYIKAAAHGIDFSLTVSSTVDEIIGKYISQTDLQTLLCDHIKDAIIAVESRGEVGGNILVNLSMQNDNYCIDIYDNGVEFSIDTLSKLGLKRVTTHSDTGGSGIGFMTTFETLKKAYASLVITEFENKTPFSKSVTFRFDGENAYIIHSYRSEELKKNINRADLVIDN